MKKTGILSTLSIVVACATLRAGWHYLFGSVLGLLVWSIARHGWQSTFPDAHAYVLLAIFLGLLGIERMARSLQRDSWR